MELINPLVEQYTAQFTTPENEILKTINHETQSHAQAHMLSGHVQGRFLSLLSNLQRPKYVLEVGTFTGYSALCLAEGLAPGGELHTIELRPEDATTAEKNFKKAGRPDIMVHVGNAKEIIPQLPYTWDLVFIDADKTGYIEYYELILTRLSEKGLIIADNILFHGQVLQEPIRGKNALAIDAFNKYVSQDGRVEQVMLPLRDGLLLIKKK